MSVFCFAFRFLKSLAKHCKAYGAGAAISAFFLLGQSWAADDADTDTTKLLMHLAAADANQVNQVVAETGDPLQPLHCSPYCTPDIERQKGELLSDPNYEFMNPREVLPPEKRTYIQGYEAIGRNFNNMQGKPIEELLLEEKEIKLNGACVVPSGVADYKLKIHQTDPGSLFSFEETNVSTDLDALFFNGQKVYRRESNKGPYYSFVAEQSSSLLKIKHYKRVEGPGGKFIVKKVEVRQFSPGKKTRIYIPKYCGYFLDKHRD